MAAQLGRSVLIKVEDSPGAGTFTTIGGLRTTGLTINNEIVDITSKDDSGVRTLLEGAGVNAIDVSGEGVFKDDASYQLVRAAAESNGHLDFQITFPGDTNPRTYEGTFAVASLEQSGEYNNEMTYSITLNSSGAITKS